MGNYFGKKNKENPNLRDNQHEQDLPHNLQKRKFEKPTIYRPQIFIDYYKSQLLKVNFHSESQVDPIIGFLYMIRTKITDIFRMGTVVWQMSFGSSYQMVKCAAFERVLAQWATKNIARRD